MQYTSPAIVVQLALEDVAGSGGIRHHRFKTQSDKYHDEFRSFFVEKIKKKQPIIKEDLNDIPEMQYQEEPFVDLVKRVFASAGFLLVLAVAFLLVAMSGLRKIGRLTR